MKKEEVMVTLLTQSFNYFHEKLKHKKQPYFVRLFFVHKILFINTKATVHQKCIVAFYILKFCSQLYYLANDFNVFFHNEFVVVKKRLIFVVAGF